MLTFLWNVIYHTLFSNANQIIPGVWLGNCLSAVDQQFITDNHINIIVNCTPNQPFITDICDHDPLLRLHPITRIRIPVYDSLLEKDLILMEQYLKLIVPYLYKQHTQLNKNILIHCHAGKQRSAIVVATLLYFLLTKGGHNFIDISHLNQQQIYEALFNYIIYKRPQAFTYGFRINFLKSFQRFLGNVL
uniref:Tyrosine specific protein phosphatases domain-containing protein n=1 Tax=viral metagenome TaxID=1070528 RepID=A0A6C0H6L0_9ZZZZ